MRAYADSSFILHLVTSEADSPRVVAEYRRLGSPKLFFLPLHALEVRNAILQRAFHQRRTESSGDRQLVAHERDTALARLEHLVARRALRFAGRLAFRRIRELGETAPLGTDG